MNSSLVVVAVVVLKSASLSLGFFKKYDQNWIDKVELKSEKNFLFRSHFGRKYIVIVTLKYETFF